MKRAASILLVFCLLMSLLTTACAEEEPRFASQEYTFFVIDEDPEFMPPTMLFFFDGVYDLPWLDVEELADLLVDLQHRVYEKAEYALSYTAEGETVTLTRENSYSMKLDYHANSITFDDYNGFLKDPTDIALLEQLPAFTGYNESGDPELFQRDALASFDRYGDIIELNLADYNIGLIHDGERYYIPLQTANDFLFAPMFGRYILFNGEAMFLANADDIVDYVTMELKPLGELYYAAQPTRRSQALADFGYNELSLMLDSLYGLKEQHNIEYFGRMFWQVAFDDALDSIDPKDADTALKNFINYYLDDLHSGFALTSWMTGYEFIESKAGPSSRLDDAQSQRYAKLREAGLGEDWQGYQEVGNTAYITLDIFEPVNGDYYGIAAGSGPSAQGERIENTAGLIVYAHQQIYREGSPIENVVIDLSNNGGGSVDAALFLMSWIIGEAEISIEDTFTGAQSTLVYRADVNLDRQFDETDTLHDKHVYCLISPVSFSCGNLVPAACKYHQAVTLIGRTTGGGACTVQPMSTAWGSMFQISGARRLSFRKNGSLYDIDEGVDPDIYIDHLELLYDREALTGMINGL